MPDDQEPEPKPEEIDLSDEGDAALDAAWAKLDADEEFQKLRGTHVDDVEDKDKD
jgi:hypothetical protein